MIKLTVTGSLSCLMDRITVENGIRINLKDMELKNGLMDLITKATFLKCSSMETDISKCMTAPSTRVNLFATTSKAKVNTLGQTVVNTPEAGFTTECTDMAPSNGQMVEYTKENTSTT